MIHVWINNLVLVFQWPLFQLDAYIKPDGEIVLDPSEKLMSHYMENITNYWDEYVRTFHNYLNDESLQIFVQPTIMGKPVDWSAGQSPNLYFLMNQDKKMLEDIAFIPYSIKYAFERVWMFLKRMQEFMDSYRDACAMDIELIKAERDTNEFKKMCENFLKQMECIEEVVSYQPLGLLFLCLTPFQELFRPQPRKLFDVVSSVTPE